MNEAPDVAMCNYRKDNTTIFKEHECFPQNIDWFGFDYYAHDSASWEVRDASSVARLHTALYRSLQCCTVQCT